MYTVYVYERKKSIQNVLNLYTKDLKKVTNPNKKPHKMSLYRNLPTSYLDSITYLHLVLSSTQYNKPIHYPI